MVLRLIIFKLAKVFVFIVLQQLVQMPEGGQRRYKIYEIIVAVAVDFKYILRCQIIAFGATKIFKLSKIEGVLNIKLKRVYFQRRKGVNYFFNPVNRRHSAARCVVIKSAVLKVGIIVNLQGRQLVFICIYQLR